MYQHLTISKLFSILGIKRHTFYRLNKSLQDKKCHKNGKVCEIIMRLNKQRKIVIYGYRRLKIYLEQLKIEVTEKQVRKLCVIIIYLLKFVIKNSNILIIK